MLKSVCSTCSTNLAVILFILLKFLDTAAQVSGREEDIEQVPSSLNITVVGFPFFLHTKQYGARVGASTSYLLLWPQTRCGMYQFANPACSTIINKHVSKSTE